jgi:hypothetical protein
VSIGGFNVPEGPVNGPVPPLNQPAHQYIPQATLQYSTFIKRALVESLQDALSHHPDPLVQTAKAALDFTHDRFRLPAVIIKFYEREMPNAGVGHYEYLPSPFNVNPDEPTLFIKYYHRLYKGDISFEVWAKSSADRDVVRDALIEILAMTDTTNQGYAFIERLYLYLNETPYGLWHFPVLNLDLITGYGENVGPAPWAPEDVLHYSCTYRVPIFGEFYSNTPAGVTGTGLVTAVEVTVGTTYNIDAVPFVIEETNFYDFAGWFTGAESI